jgi:hypothetical protein
MMIQWKESREMHHVFATALLISTVLPSSVSAWAGQAPAAAYVLALANRADGSDAIEPLATFMTYPAGAVGPARRVVQGEADVPRRYLVIAPGSAMAPGKPVQVQVE